MSRILTENSECYIRRKNASYDNSNRINSKSLVSTSSTETTSSLPDNDTKLVDQYPLTEFELSDDDLFYIWKRNSPLLYDTLLLHKLDWPSLTVDLVDDIGSSKIKGSSLIHRVFIGTHTSSLETDYVILGELKTPLYQPIYNVSDFENHADFSNKLRNKSAGNIPSFELKARLVHPGEVNRISHMPNNNFYFASQTNYGDVLVFDYSKHPSIPLDVTISHPQIVLQHHTKEGYGLNWNINSSKLTDSQQLALLSSCSSDGSLCLWDISKKSMGKYSNGNRISNTAHVIDPIMSFRHTSGLNDIKFTHEYSNVVGTVSDNGCLQIYDFRNPIIKSSIELKLLDSIKSGHSTLSTTSNLQLNCLNFNSFMNCLVITGSEIGLIHLWDLRYPMGFIKEIINHKEAVTQVSFSSFNAGIFASSSYDSTICIYDLININELIFIHKGHQGPVNDFSWSLNPRYGHTIASVGQDNYLQCWRPILNYNL